MGLHVSAHVSQALQLELAPGRWPFTCFREAQHSEDDWTQNGRAIMQHMSRANQKQGHDSALASEELQHMVSTRSRASKQAHALSLCVKLEQLIRVAREHTASSSSGQASEEVKAPPQQPVTPCLAVEAVDKKSEKKEEAQPEVRESTDLCTYPK